MNGPVFRSAHCIQGIGVELVYGGFLHWVQDTANSSNCQRFIAVNGVRQTMIDNCTLMSLMVSTVVQFGLHSRQNECLQYNFHKNKLPMICYGTGSERVKLSDLPRCNLQVHFIASQYIMKGGEITKTLAQKCPNSTDQKGDAKAGLLAVV